MWVGDLTVTNRRWWLWYRSKTWTISSSVSSARLTSQSCSVPDKNRPTYTTQRGHVRLIGQSRLGLVGGREVNYLHTLLRMQQTLPKHLTMLGQGVQVTSTAVKPWLRQPVLERWWDYFGSARVNDQRQSNQGVNHTWHQWGLNLQPSQSSALPTELSMIPSLYEYLWALVPLWFLSQPLEKSAEVLRKAPHAQHKSQLLNDSW